MYSFYFARQNHVKCLSCFLYIICDFAWASQPTPAPTEILLDDVPKMQPHNLFLLLYSVKSFTYWFAMPSTPPSYATRLPLTTHNQYSHGRPVQPGLSRTYIPRSVPQDRSEAINAQTCFASLFGLFLRSCDLTNFPATPQYQFSQSQTQPDHTHAL